MQLKGLVKFFTAALILFSLWRLSFTFIGNSVEKKVMAEVERQIAAASPNASGSEKDALLEATYQKVTDSLKGETVFNLLGMKYTYQEVKDKELQLGLDLQGGMNVTLEVGLDGLIQSMSNNPKDPALNSALVEAEKTRFGSNEDFVTLFGRAYNKLNPNSNLATLFTKPAQKNITLNSSNDAVLSVIREEAKEAVGRTHQVLSTRIDKFGVASPTINMDANKGIITVELAGVKNPESVRKYLQATAKLQFWEVATINEIGQNLVNANNAAKAYLKAKSNTSGTTTTANTSTTTDTALTAAIAATDTTNKVVSNDTGSTLESSLSNLDNDAGASNPIDSANKEEDLFTYMMPMITPEGQPIQTSAIGLVAKKDAQKVLDLLNTDVVKRNFRSDIKFLLGEDPFAKVDKENKIERVGVYAIRTGGREQAKLEGEHVTDARFDFDPRTNTPTISLEMDQEGASIWAKLTKDNIGKPIAISLDDFVYSAPNVNQEITGGRSSITGSFTPKEGTEIANILKTGKLPAPAKIVQEQVVGPTLGQESIDGAFKSFGISFAVIFVLMLIYYNSAGMVANIALILNIIFTFAVFANLGGTLTMAGIAGIILGIGMAVDANVIIFERIKEELALGLTHEQSLKIGYQRSLAPVIDGHVTSLITAIILMYFGLGPIKGFATTQIISLVLSLFTGIMVSRLITEMYMSKGRHLTYFTKFSKSIFQKANFQFIKNRKIGYTISLVLMLLGVASFFNGFDYGVEFSGGRSYVVQFDKPHTVNELRNGLHDYLDNKHPIVKTLGSNNQISITTDYLFERSDKEVGDKVVQALLTGLQKNNFVNSNVTLESFKSDYIKGVQSVSPTISKDLVNGAKWAIIYSVIAICLYIFIRFRKFQYSIGTILSLLHDALITLAVFSFCRGFVPFSLEIDQHFIAALLTVIGFSMNDTVIVYDRAREYFAKNPNGDKATILNNAINSTLTRTVMTSFTLFIVAVILFVFGGEVLRGFAFAMSIGVLVATYSSIFLAAPLLLDLDKKDSLRKEEDKDERIKILKEQA